MKHFLTIFFCIWVSLHVNSQFVWNQVIDNNNLYVSRSPIRAMLSDSFVYPPRLYLGGRPNMLTNTNTGMPCCYKTYFYLTVSNYFFYADCAPNSPVDTAHIINFSKAKDTVYNQIFMSVQGYFLNEACSSVPNFPDDLKNIIAYTGSGFHSPTIYYPLMTCSDTVFAAAALADYDNSCLTMPENYFRAYVASRCVFCHCQDSATIDSSRYIAFFDPMQNCSVTTNPINYMQGGTNGPVYALQAIDTSNVYAAGNFDSAGTIIANNIAKWNGVSWDSLGSGINGTVKVLQWYNGKLYAGGNFTMAGGVPANNIAVWNGSSWSALGSGTNGTVLALTIHNGELYAGGSFTQAGSTTVNYVAKWDGTTWSDLSGGRNGEVYSLASFQGKLFVGGDFLGGTADTAKYLAMYVDTTLGVGDEMADHNVNVFPNPTSGTVNISSGEDISRIELYNSLGELVYSQTTSLRNSQIDVMAYPAGIYFVRVITDNSAFTDCIIKE